MWLLHTAYMPCQRPLQVVQPDGCHRTVLRYSSHISVLGPGLTEIAMREYHSEVLDIFAGPCPSGSHLAVLFPDKILMLSEELAVLHEVLLGTGRSQAQVSLRDICDYAFAFPEGTGRKDVGPRGAHTTHEDAGTGQEEGRCTPPGFEAVDLEQSKEKLFSQFSYSCNGNTNNSQRCNTKLIINGKFIYVFDQNRLTVFDSTLEISLSVPWTSAVLASGLVYFLLDSALVIMDGFRAVDMLGTGGYAAMRAGTYVVVADTERLWLVFETAVVGQAEFSGRISAHAAAPDGCLIVCCTDGKYHKISTAGAKLHLKGMEFIVRLDIFAVVENTILGANEDAMFLLRGACVVEKKMFGKPAEKGSWDSGLAPGKCCCVDTSKDMPGSLIPGITESPDPGCVQRLLPPQWKIHGLGARGPLLFVQTDPRVLRIFSTKKRRTTFVQCFQEPVIRFEAAEVLCVIFEEGYELFHILEETLSPCFRRGSGGFRPQCRCPRYTWAPDKDGPQDRAGDDILAEYEASGIRMHATSRNRLVVKTGNKTREKILHDSPVALTFFNGEVVAAFENEVVFYKLGDRNILNKRKLHVKNPKKLFAVGGMLVVALLNNSFRIIKGYTVAHTSFLRSNVTAVCLFNNSLVVGTDDLYMRVYHLDTFVCICSFFADGVPHRFTTRTKDVGRGTHTSPDENLPAVGSCTGVHGGEYDDPHRREAIAGLPPGHARPKQRSKLIYSCTNGRAGEFVEIGRSFEILAAIGGHGFSYRKDQFGVVDRGYVAAAFDCTKKYKFCSRVIYKALRILNSGVR